MTKTQFIETAIQGGWNPEAKWKIKAMEISIKAREYIFAQDLWNQMIEKVILFDPLAWEAVGKVLGWIKFNGRNYCTGVNDEWGQCEEINCEYEEYWKYKMHCMVDSLCQGISLEKFLDEL